MSPVQRMQPGSKRGEMNCKGLQLRKFSGAVIQLNRNFCILIKCISDFLNFTDNHGRIIGRHGNGLRTFLNGGDNSGNRGSHFIHDILEMIRSGRKAA